MADPKRYNDSFANENGFDVEYMTDEELIERCGGERGEIKSSRIYGRDGSYDPDGLFSERVFGPEKGAVCNCGRVHMKGLWCSQCGTKAENGWKTRLGWIRLPVGWYGDNRELVADLLQCSTAQLDACWNGTASVSVGGRKVRGPQQLESAVLRSDVNRALVKLMEMAAQVENDMTDPEKADSGKDLENKLESLERRIRALRAMDAAGLRPKDLMRHVLPVMPPAFRRISEVGSDPEGRLNKSYAAVLSKSARLSSAMEVWRQSSTETGREVAVERFRSEAMEYARTLKSALEEADLFSGKQGLGRAAQKFRVPDSFSAPAIADKNLMVDEVSLPYRVLVRLYRKEIEQEMTRLISEANPEGLPENARASIRAALSSQVDVSVPSARDPDVLAALENVLSGKLVLIDRFPNVTGNSFAALRPVIGAGDSCIGVNPLICEQMKLDFDGDIPNIIKITSKRAIEEARRYLWPGLAQNSVVTGAPIHMTEREDTWGVWLMTRAWTQDMMSFTRDALITDITERQENGRPTGERAVYARHVVGKLPDNFTPVEIPEVFGKDDVIGHDGDGNEIKAPCACMMQEVAGKPVLLSLPRDCIIVPPGADMGVAKGDMVMKGTEIAQIPGLSFESMEEAMQAYSEHKVNAFTPIDVQMKNGKTVTTTVGRLMISKHLSPPKGFRLFNGQMDKKTLDKAFTRLWNEAMSVAGNDGGAIRIGEDFLARLKSIQDEAASFARDYGSFCTYDAYKFEGVNAKGMPEDLSFRSNSLLDQIKSGAKGSMNNVRLFIRFVTGLDPVRDAQFIADEVQKLDKGGKPVEGKMKPVEEAGMWQRFFAEAGSAYVIEEEDCGTTAYEKVPVPASVSDTKDAVAMLRNRTLAEDYTIGEKTWRAGEAVGRHAAELIAEDMARTGKSASVRTLLGCLCTGGCSKCYGLDPSNLRPIRRGARIGIIAGNAFTSEMREKMTLKATANTGVEDASATAVFGRIMEGDPRVWKAAIKDGPEAAAKMTVTLLDDLFRKKAETEVSRQNMEMAAKMMVNVHVTDGTGQTDERVSYARWRREFRDNPDVRSVTRIRSMRRIAEGPWGSENAMHVVALGGSKGRSMLAADSIAARARNRRDRGGRDGE